MGDMTVVYYTSNQEEEAFEAKIRASLIASIGDLPLISVSQKPINFGENICVGDVGVSNQNAHRQFQIGAKAAKTKFIAATEADCLYPHTYFVFRPQREDRAYRAPIWLLHAHGGFYKKPFSEAATIVGREYLIAMIDRSLKGRGEWSNKLEHGNRVPYTFGLRNFEYFDCDPIISMKTSNGMHKRHGTVGAPIDRLDYWGTAQEIRKEYMQ